MKISAPQLTTERLFLEEIAERDTDIIIAWRSDPEVYKFFHFPHPLSYKEHLQWFRDQYTQNENRFDWMAIETKSGKPVGIFGIKRGKSDSEEAEISYLLASEAQGKGYAGEAIKCVMEFAKEQWLCTLCIAEIHIDNHNSIRFAEKLGFTMLEIHGLFVRYGRNL